MSNTEYGLVIIKDYEDGRTFDRLLVPADKVEEVYNIIQDPDEWKIIQMKDIIKELEEKEA